MLLEYESGIDNFRQKTIEMDLWDTESEHNLN